MYIKRVTLQEFGRLAGTIQFDPNRCNIICQDNEYGKTTIMDAVLYTLYNFPTTGFSRDTLKPKDRYRPWNGQSRSPGFVVELELHDVAGRNYVLRADFNRPQPFTLHDADTHQPIALDGMSFGQRYLRMPLSSFTQCFFLRQDEQERSGKSQLVTVIEEAAASNRRETPSNVSEAIERLASPRISVPELVPEPVLVKTAIKRLQDRKADLAQQWQALQDKLERHRADIEATDELDSEIATIERQIIQGEYCLLLARRQEKQILLDRYNEGREAQAERTSLLQELEPFAAFEPTRRGQIISLLGDWKLARQRFEEVHNELQAIAEPELGMLEVELGEYPEAAKTLQSDSLDTLRSTRALLSDRESQLEKQAQLVAQLEAELQQKGVPIDRLSELHVADSSMTSTDREILFEHSEARMEAQTALASIEHGALEAREQALKAKTRKSWFGNLGLGLTGVVIGFMVVGIVLLFTGIKFFGWACLIAAALVGFGASAYIAAVRSRITSQELQPALENEMALAGQARQIREQLETIEAEYQSALDRLGLTPEQIQELREIDHWKQAAAPWTAARDAVERLQKEIVEERHKAAPLVGLVTSGIDADGIRDEAISDAVTLMDRFFGLQKSLVAASERVEKLRAERDRLQEDFLTKEEALAALVRSDLTEDLPGLEEKAQAYLDGCEKALRLQTLRQEYGSVQSMTEDEAVALQTDLDAFAKAIVALEDAHPEETATVDTQPGLRAEELERRVAQARNDRDALKERRNRGFRDAEQVVNDWRTTGPVLESDLAHVDEQLSRAVDFSRACELAHQELSEIASQVYTQWATALNERVNRIVPLVNDRYRDVALSPELDLSVYSREAGRRLESREVQHLSKGARDQLLLAMRIAIAEYLSAHVGNLPLALDEPFAHWDDQRFVEGMRFLTRLSDAHQVILLSCHGWRYAQLQENAPEVLEKLTFNNLEVEPV